MCIATECRLVQHVFDIARRHGAIGLAIAADSNIAKLVHAEASTVDKEAKLVRGLASEMVALILVLAFFLQAIIMPRDICVNERR